MISINRLTVGGLTEKLTQINPTGSTGVHTDETTAPYIDHMHIDGNWMFGSTRAAEPNIAGLSIYVWLLDFDSDSNPRLDNL